MGDAAMKWLEWRIKRLMLALDFYGLVLCGLLAAVLLLWLAQVRPLESRVADLQSELSQAPHIDVAHPAEGRMAMQSRELERFDALFPPFGELTAQLETLFRIIQKHGLSIDNGQYTLTEKPGTALRRFEARFPVDGHYPDLRQALEDIQRTLPNVAIADIQLAREDIDSPTVNAHLHFVVLVRKSS
jgi:hypothetical protein